MKLLKYVNFLESVLTVDELTKPIVGTEILKGDKLVDILSKDNPMLTTNNDNIKVPITNPKTVLNKISNKVSNDGVVTYKYNKEKSSKNLKKPNSTRYDDVFKSGVKKFTLNDFKKTIEFGGEKGAGVKTRVYESIQALFIAYCLQYSNILDGDELLLKVIELLESFVNKETVLKDILNLYTEDVKIDKELLTSLALNPDWFATFVKVPNALYSKSSRGNRIISHDKKYSLFHVSYKSDSPVVTLMKRYSYFLKENNKLDVEQKWGKINFAKYCPADLYIVETVNIETVKKEIEYASDMNDLTFRLNKLFDSSIFIPVSLKKIGKSATFDVIVNGEKGRKLPDFDIKKFKITKDPTKGIGSKIETESTWSSVTDNMPETHVSKTIGFDSSNTSKNINIDGEVEGDFSRHGKISFNTINHILKRTIDENNLDKLDSFIELDKFELTEIEKRIEDISIKIDNRVSKIIIDTDKYIKGRDNILNRKNKLISKLQSLQIIYTFIKLEEIDETISDNMMTKIMRYALSIATDSFETPRYLRII